MSDKLRAAAQQALEVLENAEDQLAKPYSTDASNAITALRAALAQAEPVQPVAWAGYDLDAMVEAFSRVIEAHHSNRRPFHNPIDMDARTALRILRGFVPAMKAHTAPQQQAEPVQADEPLSMSMFASKADYERAQQQAEPVAWADKISFENAMNTGKGHDVWPNAGDYETRTGRALIGLYTAPQQAEPVAFDPAEAMRLADNYASAQSEMDSEHSVNRQYYVQSRNEERAKLAAYLGIKEAK